MLSAQELREIFPVDIPLPICMTIAWYAEEGRALVMRKLMERKRYQQTAFQGYLDKALAKIEDAARGGAQSTRISYMESWESMADYEVAVRQQNLRKALERRGFLVYNSGEVGWA